MSTALELPGANVLFTDRAGGVSEGPYASLNLGLWTDDDPGHVRANRERVAERVGIPRERFVQGFQVHGTDVRNAGEGWVGGQSELPHVDGHVTARDDVALVVLTADCLPIALAAGDRVAMVHAGWRGLAGGIVENALAELPDGDIHAALGPCAGPCCYEVGQEVHAAFGGLGRAGDNLDLKAIARAKLGDRATVSDVDRCTMCEPDVFFSHRASGGTTGRQAGIVWRA